MSDSRVKPRLDQHMVVLLFESDVVAKARARLDHRKRPQKLADEDEAETEVGPPPDRFHPWKEVGLKRVFNEDEEGGDVVAFSVGEQEGCENGECDRLAWG